MLKLKCAVHNYDWGKQGTESLVAKIYQKNGGQVLDDKCYAEYWMGTHQNGPSCVETANNEILPLKDFICKSSGNDGLNFLMKVLSIKDPLSIQVHPDKAFAETLFKSDPIHYKDPNHKPELAVAISAQFRLLFGLVGVKSAYEVINLFRSCFEQNLALECEAFLNEPNEFTYQQFLISLILLDETAFHVIIQQIVDFISDSSFILDEKYSMILNLYEKYGKDIGVLVALFMNFFTLSSGDAIFIPPNIVHSYLEGDCIECMANSDNVIRMGLTKKFIDTASFIHILKNEFSSIIMDSIQTIGVNLTENIRVFQHEKFKDFMLNELLLNEDMSETFQVGDMSILLILEGKVQISSADGSCLIAEEYESYFIENGCSLQFQSLGIKSRLFISSSKYDA